MPLSVMAWAADGNTGAESSGYTQHHSHARDRRGIGKTNADGLMRLSGFELSRRNAVKPFPGL